jgi:hypothetical protein
VPSAATTGTTAVLIAPQKTVPGAPVHANVGTDGSSPTLDARAFIAAFAQGNPGFLTTPRLFPLANSVTGSYSASNAVFTGAALLATPGVRADLFGITGPAPILPELERVEVIPAQSLQTESNPAGNSIRTVGGEEQRPTEPPQSSPWSRLEPGLFDVRDVPALPAMPSFEELMPSARSAQAPLIAAATLPISEPRKTSTMPLLIGLLGVGSLLALRTGIKKRSLLRVAALVLESARTRRRPSVG